MDITFLSPSGALLVFAVALPLLALGWTEWRARRVRARIGLAPPAWRARAAIVAALAGVAALVALAAAQPVLGRSTERRVRGDAEAFVVFDTSRSMLASQGPDGKTRLQRAVALSRRLRGELPDIRFGIASLTDRLLPHVFPSVDPSLFDAALDRVVGIESPPPGNGEGQRVTTLGALAAIATRNFFSPSVPHRLAIVMSDAETNPYAQASVAALFRRPPAIHLIFVRFWHADERVYTTANTPEAAYQPDPASAQNAQRLAIVTGGRAFDENQLREIVDAAKRALGTGTDVREREQRSQVALAPYVALGALVPLGFLFWRRNL